MIYPIVIYGDEVLRKRCREIGPDYPEVKKLAEDMFLTLEEAEGVGLAAPQIGKDIRLFIVDCTPWAEDDPSCAAASRFPASMPTCRARSRSGCATWIPISWSTTRSSRG